ncbi:MAG: hypothetical protein MJY50_04440 [Bacteroidales bacterium]|nr:hypothetical protein [Bacteroidales bacterium]
MKKIATIVVLLGIVSLANAQSSRIWSAGPLTWDDFTQKSVLPEETKASDVSITIAAYEKSVQKDGINIVYNDASAFINPSSWVDKTRMTAAELKKAQDKFDIAQDFANRLREEMMFAKGDKRDVVKKYQNDCKAALDAYELDSSYPVPAVSREEFDITRMSWRKSDVTLGLNLGVTGSFPMGPIADVVNPSVGITLGGELFFNRHGVMVDFDFGAGVIKKGNSRGWLAGWDNGMVPNYSVNLMYSYLICNRDRFHLGVMAGPGYNARLFAVQKGLILDRVEQFTLGGFNVREGVYADWILSRNATFNRTPSATDLALRFKLYGDQTFSNVDKMVVPSINISVALLVRTARIFK